MNAQLRSDIWFAWFADVDDLPWFIKEMGLSSCYDVHYHKEKLEAKYGIYRRSPLGDEYGHHFVFTDKEKYYKELARYEAEKASSSAKKPVESSTMNNNTRPSINRLIEELNTAREHVTRVEDAIRNCNLTRVQAFKEEFDALRERYSDVKLAIAYADQYHVAVARIKNPTGLSHEEVQIF